MNTFDEHIKGATITETPLGPVATVFGRVPVAYSDAWVMNYRAVLAREIAALCEQMGAGASAEDCAMSIRHAYNIPDGEQAK